MKYKRMVFAFRRKCTVCDGLGETLDRLGDWQKCPACQGIGITKKGKADLKRLKKKLATNWVD